MKEKIKMIGSIIILLFMMILSIVCFAFAAKKNERIVDNREKETIIITTTTVVPQVSSGESVISYTIVSTTSNITTSSTTSTTTTTTTTTPATIEPSIATETNSTKQCVENNQVEPEKIYYKYSTHYVHRSTCFWIKKYPNENKKEITCEADIGEPARYCSDCNPPIEITNVYEESYTENNIPVEDVNIYKEQEISEVEFVYLANVLYKEYGQSYISGIGNADETAALRERAKVIEVVMNRVKSKKYPNSIKEVLEQPKQFSGYNTYKRDYFIFDKEKDYWIIPSVNYYFEHIEEFNHGYIGFSGNGIINIFH